MAAIVTAQQAVRAHEAAKAKLVTDPVKPASLPLGELDWMVGKWYATVGDDQIELDAHWKNSYLMQRFVVRRDEKIVRRSTQRVAWDPIAGGPRSWNFNPDGSYSEARWRKEKDVWVVESHGVHADGSRMKSVHFWAPVSDEECWFKSVKGEVNGEATEDLVLTFSRLPLESSKKSPAAPSDTSE